MTSGRRPTQRPRSDGWLLGAIRTDLRHLHDGWMGLAFQHHRQQPHPVLGDWQPESGFERSLYRFWAVLGGGVVLLLYPVLLAGFAIRYHVSGMDRFAARVGLVGIVLVSVFAWAALTAGAYLRDVPFEGVVALLAAGGVATISAVLARLFSVLDGRPVSILFAYPFGVTAVFLPPVVAALYSQTLASVVFARSDVLAIWLLDTVLAVGGINAFLRATFDLVGLAYVGMWFAIAIPIGWVLGTVVALADAVRPTGEEENDAMAT